MTAEPLTLSRVGRAPSPPRHLWTDGRRLWARVAAEYFLESHHREVLTIAAESLDRAAQARAEIDRTGLLLVGSHGGMVVNPLLATEREAHRTCLRALRQLGLDLEAPGGRK